jgi:hypothetical protein
MWRIFGIIYFQDKLHFVDVEKKTYRLDAIKEVGIIPGHAPPLLCRRKRAEHQQLGIARQPRLKRMILNHSTVNYKLLTIN